MTRLQTMSERASARKGDPEVLRVAFLQDVAIKRLAAATRILACAVP